MSEQWEEGEQAELERLLEKRRRMGRANANNALLEIREILGGDGLRGVYKALEVAAGHRRLTSDSLFNVVSEDVLSRLGVPLGKAGAGILMSMEDPQLVDRLIYLHDRVKFHYEKQGGKHHDGPIALLSKAWSEYLERQQSPRQIFTSPQMDTSDQVDAWRMVEAALEGMTPAFSITPDTTVDDISAQGFTLEISREAMSQHGAEPMQANVRHRPFRRNSTDLDEIRMAWHGAEHPLFRASCGAPDNDLQSMREFTFMEFVEFAQVDEIYRDTETIYNITMPQWWTLDALIDEHGTLYEVGYTA